MKRSKERDELLTRLCTDFHDYFSHNAEENHLTIDECWGVCVRFLGVVIGETISSKHCKLETARTLAEIIGLEVGRAILNSYSLCETKNMIDGQRDNKRKDPA